MEEPYFLLVGVAGINNSILDRFSVHARKINAKGLLERLCGDVALAAPIILPKSSGTQIGSVEKAV